MLLSGLSRYYEFEHEELERSGYHILLIACDDSILFGGSLE